MLHRRETTPCRAAAGHAAPAPLAVLCAVLLALAVLIPGHPAQASGQSPEEDAAQGKASVQAIKSEWRIDTQRFLTSVHGNLACLDCHYDVADQERHPNPENVLKSPDDFFAPERCYDCHPEAQVQVEIGKHGNVVGTPESFANCISCHDPHYQGANPSLDTRSLAPEDMDCVRCHGSLPVDHKARVARDAALCMSCHGAEANMGNAERSPAKLLAEVSYQDAPHRGLACSACHEDADRYPHANIKNVACESCHVRHPESMIHDAHLTVTCEACHQGGSKPVRAGTGPDAVVTAQSLSGPGQISAAHDMRMSQSEEFCRRCHVKGNEVGAVAMVLPAKSVICMPCHTATLTLHDPISVVAVIAFLAGVLLLAGLWFGRASGPAEDRGMVKFVRAMSDGVRALAHPAKLEKVGEALFMDVLLQRRLWLRSPKRWLIHSLIFYPFVIRFVWGVVALFLTWAAPEWAVSWGLTNKNNPLTALVFDLTGLAMLAGLGWAFKRGREAERGRLPGLPAQDLWALGLIAAVVAAGFVAEAMRIALTGWPAGSGWSFVGTTLSWPMAGIANLEQVYGWFWYLHALLTGATLAYLPFSRLMHIIMAPVVLAMNAGSEHEHH